MNDIVEGRDRSLFVEGMNDIEEGKERSLFVERG